MSEPAYDIQPANLPECLTQLNQWHLWRFDKDSNGKPTKVPYQPVRTSNKAQSNNPATWGTFGQALGAQRRGLGGLGFMFTPDDPFVGIDLDACRDPETGVIAPWASEIIAALDTYCEVSPSRTGVKLFLRGKWPFPKGKNKKLTDRPKVSGKVPGIEGYDWGRYFAVTGDRLNGPAEPQERQQQLDALCQSLWPARDCKTVLQTETNGRTDVIDRARKYIAKMPPAIEGENGSGATFSVACALCIGFALDRSDALALLTEYSQRCVPPWREHELVHKIDDAMTAEGERGHLLNKPLQQPRDNCPEVQADDRPDFSKRDIQDNCPELEPKRSTKRAMLTRLDSIEPEAVQWLWPGRVAKGKITVVAGQAGTGKSLCTVDIGARITRGAEWPNGEGRAEVGDVIFLSAEDTPQDVILPRFIEAGGDRSRAHVFEAVKQEDADGEEFERAFNLAADLDALDAALEQLPDARLLVIDPIGSYLGRGTDSHRDADVRSVLSPLVTLADKHGIAVVLVCHVSKSQATSAQDRIMGSVAFSALARAAWLITRDKEDPARRWMSCAKNNLGTDQLALSYRLASDTEGKPPHLEWYDEGVQATADDMVAEGQSTSKRDEVATWLADFLADGPKLARTVFPAGEALGFSERTIKRAKAALGVDSYKDGSRGWQWELPADAKGASSKTWPSWPPSAPSGKTGVSRGPLQAKGAKWVPGQVGAFEIGEEGQQGCQLTEGCQPNSSSSTEEDEGCQEGQVELSQWDSGIDPSEVGL